MKRILFLLASFLIVAYSYAQTGVEGRWKTFDEKTGEMKSIVEITVKNGKLHGKIVELGPKSDKNKVCTECTDHRKGAKILGMEIITGLEKNGIAWEGNKGILDPENGKLYNVKIWVEEGKLQVRGYIGFLFRTQTWERV